ncbi:hypothetical protein C7B61_03365 [filamentous cyanobacterium CCP1]|nr:hypothetical protein C7B76_05015 [filamentous cyanobacterium CCP2]PSB67962.1 hypothetical protein C7B61_03365 [filamentous cyanobacterium CCP1]
MGWLSYFSYFFTFIFFGDVGLSTGITLVFGDGLSVTLAFVRQQELYPPVGAVLLEPFSLSVHTLPRPEEFPQDNLQDSP